MIDLFAAYLAAMCLLFALVTYLWFTRDDPRGRDLAPMGDYPYPPELSDFPYPELSEVPDNSDAFGWVNPSYTRLATTGELRALAYAGNMETINSEVAAFTALMRLDDWVGQ